MGCEIISGLHTDAKFDKDLILDYTRIHKMTLGAEFGYNSNISLKGADFDQIRNIRWDPIKEHLDYEKNGGTAYLKLVENLKNLGFFDDADDCYYEYRKAEMKEKGRPYLSKFYDFISFLSCGYGVRPGFTIACMFSFIYIFGSLFWYINKISVTKLLIIFIKFYILNSALVFGNIPKFGLQNCNSFLDNLYLSMMVFIGHMPSDFEPVGFLKFAAILEGILGYLFLALFIVVLARKLIR